MHDVYLEIPNRILDNAIAALSQANTHSVYMDPGREYWPNIAVLNSAHAGELFMKAIIASAHPLLIFKNIFEFDDNSKNEIDITHLIAKAKTHDFQHLPKIMWAVLKERLPDPGSFEDIRSMRNAIQHFYHPAGSAKYGAEATKTSLRFIYNNIDPIIYKYFGLYAIEYHEDYIGYDYVVACILRHQLKFSVPDDFNVGEINIEDEIKGCSDEYREWVERNLLSRKP